MSADDITHQCFYCGWSFQQSVGDPASGVAPGTPWDAVPDDWRCPNCGASKAEFAGVADQTA